MSTSTEIEPTAAGGELAVSAEMEAQLAARVKGKVDRDKLTLPALKVVNGTSKEADEISLGHLCNGLTGDDYGTEVGVVISDFYYGRFYAEDDGGKAYSTRDEIAPSNWPEQYAGQRFTELDDAEERWKDAVNENEHPWGSGPPIQTTVNFVIHRADDPEGAPLRLSMKSADTPTANKILQLITFGQMPWDFVYEISSDKRPVPNGKGNYYGFAAKQNGKVTPEQRQNAIKLAMAFQQAVEGGNVEEAGTEDADAGKAAKAADRKRAAAAADDGLGVD